MQETAKQQATSGHKTLPEAVGGRDLTLSRVLLATGRERAQLDRVKEKGMTIVSLGPWKREVGGWGRSSHCEG